MNLNTAATAHCLRSVDLDEVCPLCLSRYAAVDESICVTCEAPSCPDCAEVVAGTNEILCFACHGPTKH